MTNVGRAEFIRLLREPREHAAPVLCGCAEQHPSLWKGLWLALLRLNDIATPALERTAKRPDIRSLAGRATQ